MGGFINGGTPIAGLDGLFHGKSHLEIWMRTGVPPFMEIIIQIHVDRIEDDHRMVWRMGLGVLFGSLAQNLPLASKNMSGLVHSFCCFYIHLHWQHSRHDVLQWLSNDYFNSFPESKYTWKGT